MLPDITIQAGQRPPAGGYGREFLHLMSELPSQVQPVPRMRQSSVPLTPRADRELNPSLQQLLFTNNSQGSSRRNFSSRRMKFPRKQHLLLSVGEDAQNSSWLENPGTDIDSVIHSANNLKHLFCRQPSCRLRGAKQQTGNTVPPSRHSHSSGRDAASSRYPPV